MKIISADYVLTMNTALECLSQGAVLIDGNIIQAVDSLQSLAQQYPEVEV